MIPYPPPSSHHHVYFPDARLLDKLLNVIVMGFSKGVNSPIREIGLKLNSSDTGFTADFYQKPVVQNSVGRSKVRSRKKRRKKRSHSSTDTELKLTIVKPRKAQMHLVVTWLMGSLELERDHFLRLHLILETLMLIGLLIIHLKNSHLILIVCLIVSQLKQV